MEKLGARILKQGACRLAKARILPFYTPQCGQYPPGLEGFLFINKLWS